MTEGEVRAWLLGYAWLDEPQEAKAREVECIMTQDGWKYIDAVADQYAGAQNEPGPEAVEEGTAYALSALYECHTGPHLAICPRK
jgi:hypothetical protein